MILVILFVGVTTFSVFAASAYSTPAELAAGLTGRTTESVTEERAETGKTYGTIADEASKLIEFREGVLQIKKDILAAKVAEGIMTQAEADEMIALIEQHLADCDGTGKADGQQLGIGFGQKGGQGECRGEDALGTQNRKGLQNDKAGEGQQMRQRKGQGQAGGGRAQRSAVSAPGA